LFGLQKISNPIGGELVWKGTTTNRHHRAGEISDHPTPTKKKGDAREKKREHVSNSVVWFGYTQVSL
jgi:hypothetical protein